ncbi:uncharacterized protein IWZ02DRAFT_482463 [Phyllosticta citriasiana]|uniref:uncharacterized protein n=1 Tax=Phyllosticta citriasiana TaxID=595635 RepID=UPI0030FD72AA
MLNGSFRESQPPPSGELREVELPDDDAAALKILLNIAHLHFDQIPSKLELLTLYKVTVLTDKYDATRLIRPWAQSWTDEYLNHAEDRGFEEWLWIAWELGMTEIFERTTHSLVTRTEISEHGTLVNIVGRILDPTGNSGLQFPPDIIESITKTRKKVISDLLEACYSALDRFIEQNDARSIYGGKFSQCDAMTFGSLCLSLCNIGLGLQRPDAGVVKKTVNDLYVHSCRFDAARFTQCPRECVNGGLNAKLQAARYEVHGSISSAILDVHYRHLGRQAKKSGIK